MLQPCVQQTWPVRIPRTKTELRHSQLLTFYTFGNLAERMFVVCLTDAFQVRSRFQTTHIAQSLYFRNSLLPLSKQLFAAIDNYAKDGGPGKSDFHVDFCHEPLRSLIVKQVQ